MNTASRLLYEYRGRPPVDCVSHAFDCYVCASPSSLGVSVGEWMGANFTGQNRVRSPASSHVCDACVWAMAGKPPHTERMWSHLYSADEYLRVNKGRKAEMRAWLRRPHTGPCFAAIADSGQKHLIPWAPICHERVDVVNFEDRIVEIGDWQLVDDLSEMLTLGATKEEIQRGEYSPRAWTLITPPRLREYEQYLRRLRASGWFDLALWLSQRDEIRVQERIDAERRTKRKPEKQDRRRPARDASGVPPHIEAERSPALGHAPGSDASGSPHDVESGRVGHGDLAQVAVGEPQLGLFGGAPVAGRRGARAGRKS